MFEVFIRIAAFSLPVFVFLTMFNVGLTQEPKAILRYISYKRFTILVLIANLLIAPLIMWLMLRFFSIDPFLGVGLTIFSMCAGAPFLIKLTQLSKNDLALGAGTMIILVLATVIVVPLLLPLAVPKIEINGWLIAWTLIKQLLIPIAIGMVLAKTLPKFVDAIQPWVARIGNWSLYILLSATLIGYFPQVKNIVGEGAIAMGVVFILLAFATGYLIGGRNAREHLRDVAALGTAQRNTSASMIIAVENFSEHPQVLVIITIANTLGIAMLLGIAKFLSKDNKIEIIRPGKNMVPDNNAELPGTNSKQR